MKRADGATRRRKVNKSSEEERLAPASKEGRRKRPTDAVSSRRRKGPALRNIGIDLGKVNSQLSERDSVAEEIRNVRFAMNREALRKAVGPGKARILIEACTPAAWVARFLRSFGHEVIVADPNYLPMYVDKKSKRRKTDRRDSRALSLALLHGNWREAHLRSEEAQERKRLVDARSRLVRSRTRHINGVRSTFAQQGATLPMGSPAAFARCVREHLEPLPAETRATVGLELKLIEHLDEQIAAADERLQAEAKRDPVAKLLVTVPGVGTITATAFAATVDEPGRFDDGGQLASFLGLVPSEMSSGERRVQGRITKTGPAHLRGLLVQAAWCIWRSKDADARPLRQWAERLAARRGKRVAVVALARRLSCILLAMWKTKCPYDPSKHAAAPKKPRPQAAAANKKPSRARAAA